MEEELETDLHTVLIGFVKAIHLLTVGLNRDAAEVLPTLRKPIKRLLVKEEMEK